MNHYEISYLQTFDSSLVTLTFVYLISCFISKAIVHQFETKIIYHNKFKEYVASHEFNQSLVVTTFMQFYLIPRNSCFVLHKILLMFNLLEDFQTFSRKMTFHEENS